MGDQKQPNEDLKGTLFATTGLGILMVISWLGVLFLYLSRF